jgi:NAD(P)-dependent dehydrogenase (short-subunit alcohol dehydrogenase family)
MNCLIIGGTSGIGLEAARIFKKKGYEVVVCGRRKNEKIDFNFLKVDVTKEASVKSLFNNI